MRSAVSITPESGDFVLQRLVSKEDRTLGKFYSNDGMQLGYVLEDVVRTLGEYVFGVTAIPPGRYRLIVNFSNRFQREMIQLINIRGSSTMFGPKPIDAAGVRIHGGNKPEDTEGCLLLGTNIDSGNIIKATIVSNCKDVVDHLITSVKKLNETQEVYLTVTESW